MFIVSYFQLFNNRFIKERVGNFETYTFYPMFTMYASCLYLRYPAKTSSKPCRHVGKFRWQYILQRHLPWSCRQSLRGAFSWLKSSTDSELSKSRIRFISAFFHSPQFSCFCCVRLRCTHCFSFCLRFFTSFHTSYFCRYSVQKSNALPYSLSALTFLPTPRF